MPQDSSARPGDTQASQRREAIARLHRAWRGEIEAGAVYERIARRESDPRRAEILRRMADAEGGHRRRIEERLKELGEVVSDPASVRLGAWERLQARLAPIDRLLARREAAEDDEVGDLYGRPTGDAQTDRLLADIRSDEQSHSLAVAEMRGAEAPTDHAAHAASRSPATASHVGSDGHSAGVEPPGGAQRHSAAVDPQTRLDRILRREDWHSTGTSWVSGAIYGANDGLAAVFGIVSGVSGATGGSHFVLTAGVAGAVASALSMATGAFLAERSEGEVRAANLDRERREIAEHPEEEREELSLFYQLKGLDQAVADQLAHNAAKDPDAMLKLLAAEELGGGQYHGDPVQASIAAGLSTALGGIVPVIPFFFISGTAGIIAAAVVSLVAHFLVGAAKSLVTLRTWWSAGLEMTAAGVIVGSATYGLGLLFPVGT